MRILYVLMSALIIVTSVKSEELIGISRPYREIELSFPETGVIHKLSVREGSIIKKGQYLAQLDQTLLLASLKIALARARNQGQLKAAQAQLALAQKKIKRLLELQQRNHARPQEVEKVRAEETLAKANLLASQEQLRIYELEADRIRIQVKQRTLRSPVSGMVRKVLREIGENVSLEEPVLQLVQLDRLKIICHVPLAEIAKVSLKQKAKVRFLSSQKDVRGRVIFIDPVVDSASKTVRVVIGVKNAQKNLLSGVRCSIIWIAHTEKVKPLEKEEKK